jgi:integrase/recombinase XerD
MSELYKRPDSKYYWYTLGEGKSRIRRSTQCADLGSATRVQKKWDEQYIEKTILRKAKCSHLILSYLTQLESRKSLGWFKRIRSGLNNFKDMYGDMEVRNIDINDIDNYTRIREGLIAPKTLLEEIKILHNFFKFALARGYTEVNPCKDIILPKIVRVRTTRAFTKEELQLLMQTKHPKDYFLWHILFYTGLRLGDAVSLDKSQIQNDCIKRKQIKTGNEVVIPIHKILLPMFKKGFEDNLMKYGATGRSRERVKLIAKDCNLHTFRHSFATYLEQECGASRYDVKVLLGHKNGDVTANYIHTNVDQLRMLINRLRIN